MVRVSTLRLAASLLCFFLISTLVPSSGFAQPVPLPTPTPEVVASSTPEPDPSPLPDPEPTTITELEPIAPAREEVVGLRTKYSKTFVNEDDTYTEELSLGAIHFRNEQGEWEDIDTALQQLEDGSWVNRAGPFQALFEPRSGGRLLSLTVGDRVVSIDAPGAAADVDAVVSGNIIEYPLVYPHTDIRFVVSPESVEELFVLRERPTSNVSFEVPIVLGDLTPREEPDGSISLISASGNTVISIPPLEMYDSGEVAESKLLDVSVSESGQSLLLTIDADDAWLADPARVYPVMVDPDLNMGGHQDAWIEEGDNNTHANDPELLVGKPAGTGRQRTRALLKFTHFENSNYRHVTDAYIELYMSAKNTGQCDNLTEISVHEILQDWRPADSAEGPGVTWSIKPDDDPTPLDRTTLDCTLGKDRWASSSLTALVQEWVKVPTFDDAYGVMFRSYSGEGNPNYFRQFASKNFLDTSKRPLLSITYDIHSAIDLAPNDGTVSVNTAPTLSAQLSANGHSDSLRFEVYPASMTPDETSNNVTTCPSGATCSTQGPIVSGNRVSWTPSLPLGRNYKWRVRSASLFGRWSETRTFSVLPPSPAISCPQHPTASGAGKWSSSDDVTCTWDSTNGNHQVNDSYRYRLLPGGSWTSTSLTTTGLMADRNDGQYTLEVVRTRSGVDSQTATYPIWIDASPPPPPSLSCNPGGSAWSGDNTPEFSFPSSDMSEIQDYTWQFDQTSGKQLIGNNTTTASNVSLPAQADGVYYFTVEARNGAGATSQPSECTVKIDALPPSITIDSSSHPDETNEYPLPASFSWSAATEQSGIVGYTYAVDAPAPHSNPTSTASAQFNNLGPGTHTLNVAVKNGAGVWGDKARTFVITDNGPETPIVTCDSHPDPTKWYSSDRGRFLWSVTAPPSGISAYSYQVSTQELAIPDDTPEQQTTATSSSVQNFQLVQGIQWFQVKARNGNQKWGSPGRCKLRVDSTAPDSPGSVTSSSHTPYVKFKSTKARMHWLTAKDHDYNGPGCSDSGGCSGSSGYQYLFSRDDVEPDWATDPLVQTTASADISEIQRDLNDYVPAGQSADGTWYFHIRTVDAAGNGSTKATYGPIVVGPDGLDFPLAPTLDDVTHTLYAQSDEMGLEKFYAYRDFDLGSSKGFINLKTGNLVVQDTDFEIPRPGLNAIVRHTYNSQRDEGFYHDEGLGLGWSLSVTDGDIGIDGLQQVASGIDLNAPIQRAEVLKDGIAGILETAGFIFEFTDGDGTTHRFVKETPTSTEWLSPPGVDLVLREVGNAFELVRPDGVVYRIELITSGTFPTLAVKEIRDRNGNRLVFTYEAVGVETFLRGARVRSVTDGAGDELVTFTYDINSGSLAVMTASPEDANRVNSFDVQEVPGLPDADHRLLKAVHDSDGTVDERSVSFDYSPQPGGELVAKQMLTKVTDGRGNATNFTFEREGRRFRVKNLADRESKSWQLSYAPVNGNERQTILKTPLLFEFRYMTSLRAEVPSGEKMMAGGNILRISDPGTSAFPSSSTGRFDTRYVWSKNRLTSVRQAVSPDTNPYNENSPSTFIETAYRYNALGQVIEISEPPANDTTRNDLPANASKGRLLTKLSYDFGDGVCVTPPDDGQSLSPVGEGESVGDLCRVVLTDSVGTATRTTDFQVDTHGNVTDVWMRGDGTQAHPDRHVHMTYHPDGTLHEFDGPRDAADMAGQQVNDLTKFTNYSPTGKARTITDPFGNATSYSFNAFGLMSSHTDRELRQWTYSYDHLNNLESEADPDGDTHRYTWDPNDQIETSRTPMGKLTEYKYDKNEHLTEVLTPGPDVGDTQTSTRLDYRNDGLLWKEYLPVVKGAATPVVNTRDYFGGGLLKSEVRAVGTGQTGTTSYTYDRLGRVNVVTYPSTGSGTPSEQRFYADNGNLIKTQHTSQSGARDRERKFTYSRFGEQVEVLQPISGVGTAQTLHEFSPFGELEATKRKKDDGTYITSRNGYDDAGNLVKVTVPGPTSDMVSEYVYDAMNRLAAQTRDPLNGNHTVEFGYDKDGLQTSRLDKVSGQLLRTFSWTYNDDLSVQSSSVMKGTQQAYKCYFDGRDKFGNGPFPESGYDADGNLLVFRQLTGDNCMSASSASKTIFKVGVTYDERGWLEEATHGYGPESTLFGKAESVQFDRAGRVRSWTYGGLTTTYDVSPGGFTESIIDWRQSSNVTTFSYVPSGDVASISLGSQAVRGSANYSPDGSLRELTWKPKNLDQPFRSHTALSYNVQGFLQNEQVFQALAPGATDTGGTARYDYDLLGRLTSWTSPFELEPTQPSPSTRYRLLDSGDLDKRSVFVQEGLVSEDDFVYAQNLLQQVQYTPQAPALEFQYDELGQEKAREQGNRSIAIDYDGASHIKQIRDDPTPSSRDGAGWSVDYVYDLDDRLLFRKVSDEEGAAAPRDRETHYLYSIIFDRVVAEANGSVDYTVRYLIDLEGRRLAQETWERYPNEDGVTGVKTWTWLLRDPQGNVATLVRDDGNGATAVTKQKSYDPYGRTDAKGSGPTDPDGPFGADVPESNFGYNDEFTDLATGRLSIGPRQYDPEIARFTSPDFFVGANADRSLATDPLTGNRYLFAAANPVSFADDGHRPVCDGNCAQTVFLPERDYAKNGFLVGAVKNVAGISADIGAATGRFVARNARTIGSLAVTGACIAGATAASGGTAAPVAVGTCRFGAVALFSLGAKEAMGRADLGERGFAWGQFVGDTVKEAALAKLTTTPFNLLKSLGGAGSGTISLADYGINSLGRAGIFSLLQIPSTTCELANC